jgi:hypothetical protein
MRPVTGRLALLVAALTALAAPASAVAGDPCPASRDLRPGPGAHELYRTVAPFEHDDSARSQLFPFSCTLRRLTGEVRPAIAARAARGDYATPYSVVTRRRRELFVYGYRADANTQGAYVARVDPGTLRERWRTDIPDRRPRGQWSYPGVLLAHADGRLYAIYGNRLAALDPRTGRIVARRALPEDPHGTGAAYNGMVVLPHGRIVAKKIERGPCPTTTTPPAQAGALAGLTCAVANHLPSEIVVVDPRRLRILSHVVTPEPVTGRITAGRVGRRVVVYCAGSTHLFRYVYHPGSGRLRRDPAWGEIRYRFAGQTPGTGPGVMGHWVVVQTNFLPATTPLTVTAVDARDPRRVFRIRPFARVPAKSWIVSKAALDAANRTVVTHDTDAERMAALRLDPRRGFRVRWRRPLQSLDFSALVGSARGRQIVIPALTAGRDHVVWLDERTGRLRARTRALSRGPAPGNIVSPGFGGRFWYASAQGVLWRLTPRAR